MEKLAFKELLQEVQTPEAVMEAKEALIYINGELDKTKVPTPDGPLDLTPGQRSIFAAALLIAYGKRKNPAGGATPAGDPKGCKP